MRKPTINAETTNLLLFNNSVDQLGLSMQIIGITNKKKMDKLRNINYLLEITVFQIHCWVDNQLGTIQPRN
jgi:hypothetical protein